MKIHYKIIKKIPLDSQIIVRYFTDIATEQYLATETGEHGEITRSRADFTVQIPMFSEDSVEEIIKKNCPYQALEIEEKKILTASGTVHKELVDVMNKIDKVSVGKIKTLEFPSTLERTDEEVIADRLKKIDADADFLIYSVYGARESIYKKAYQDAIAFRDAGYKGDIAPYLSLDPNVTPQNATDIIIKKHEYSNDIVFDINKNRLIVKSGVRSGKDKALNTWNKYVTKIKTKIGD